MARAEPLISSRASVCFGLPDANDVVLPHDHRYSTVLSEHYQHAVEAGILEKSILLQDKIRDYDHDDIWEIFCAGVADLFDAQLSFVSTRVTHDRFTGRELPEIGEVGSYLNALGMYAHDPNLSIHSFDSELLYKAWDCPCSGMKHGKVFIIAKDGAKFTPNNPNAQFLPFEPDSYIAVPCKIKGGSIGHFGVIWNKTGSLRRTLDWGFIESVLHSFEDLVSARVMKYIEQDSLAHWRTVPMDTTSSESVPALTDFRPHAQVLSHELRTPMQGIVGPLDTIQATIDTALDSGIRLKSKDLQHMKDDIQAIQSSANRAIDATENIIEAYKLDMGRSLRSRPMINATPTDSATRIHAGLRARRLSGAADASRGKKRKLADRDFENTTRALESVLNSAAEAQPPKDSHLSDVLAGIAKPCRKEQKLQEFSKGTATSEQKFQVVDAFHQLSDASHGRVHCNVKSLIRKVIDNAFKGVGRPDQIDDQTTSDGQILKATYKRSTKSDDDWHFKTIRWAVSADVPDTILVREAELHNLVSQVFKNALKFTNSANIELQATLDEEGEFIVFVVSDTGPGIRPQFQSKIFEAFTREDTSITRNTEGSGLGLLVAKGLAAKSGGDVELVRSETEGAERGSVFHIRIPVNPPGLQTPDSCQSAHSSVAGDDHSARRRRSDASSHFLRTGQLPVSTKQEPFGRLDEVLITPASSTDVSPQLPSVPEAFQQGPTTLAVVGQDDEQVDEEVVIDNRPMTILLVEDNDVSRQTFLRMLEKLGHPRERIHVAIDGADAIRQATGIKVAREQELRNSGSATTPPIDVVFMDIWMPNIDGYQATREIMKLYASSSQIPSNPSMRRCISEPGNVPVLSSSAVPAILAGTSSLITPAPTFFGLSADATDDARSQGMQLGWKQFVGKPVRMNHLREMIHEARQYRARAQKAKA